MNTPLPVTLGGDSLPLLIAGPCVIEGDISVDYAHQIAETLSDLPFQWVFKASFDKANRTGSGSPRGAGMAEGIRILGQIGEEIGVPVLTDVHLPEQCKPAAEVASILQIPAFLARQTDLIEAAAQTGRAINIKKGQFMAPNDVVQAAAKATSFGSEEVIITERGTFFGYGRLVVDFASLPDLKNGGHPVLLDATHSVQSPGALGDRSGGDWTRAPLLLKAGAAAGFDGFFLETHPTPERSPSDGPNMIPLHHLREIVEDLLAIRSAHQKSSAV
jgi:2-dehydro-3-deoxyphosphooctonate aldolase (KDO 8-P synthase)